MKGIKRFVLILTLMALIVASLGSGPAWSQEEQADPPDSYDPQTDLTISDVTPALYFDDTDYGHIDWAIRAAVLVPSAVLEIRNTTADLTPVRIEDGAPDWSLVIDDSGDVGLGTDSPIVSLDIRGSSPDLRLYNTSTSSEIFRVYSSGLTEAKTATGDAVRGLANATSGNWWGVYGQSQSPDGEGVFGINLAPTGYARGVYGETGSSSGRAVEGWAYNGSGWNYGVYGRSSSTTGRGVYGIATANSGSAFGVLGRSKSKAGRGVYGSATATTGTTYGVFGESESPDGRGVYGYASATSGWNYGVLGRTNSPNGWAGRFVTTAGRGVYISAAAGKEGLNVVSGTKNAVVRTADGSRLMYTEESTAVWFTDYGFGQLQNGVAVIRINPLFAQTVNLNEPYHVFLEEYGDAELYVSQRTPEWFEVRLGRRNRWGDRNAAFSYRLVAKRLGYEGQYLERAPWADDDPNLYPELRKAWEAEEALAGSMEEQDLAESPEALSPKLTEGQ